MKVIYTDEASEDLDGILAYIASAISESDVTLP
jgi:plasmid stabilization system protein ParE